ncbi:MAG: endopeptidase La [Ignavibacteria bacterium]|jgi:ATP-dependent Lon protease|nr:endopeptidase La [Ignavibacteria bacterium]
MAKKKETQPKESIQVKPPQVSVEDLLKFKEMINPEVFISSIPKKLSILPLRDIVIFPNMIFPVLIGRAASLMAVNEAIDRDKFIFVAAQRDQMREDLDIKDLYKYGTVAKVIQVLRLPNNLLKVLVEGFFQAKIVRKIENKQGYLEAEIKIIEQSYDETDVELKALIRRASDLFAEYVRVDRNLPPEVVNAFDSIENPTQKLYYGAANIRTVLEQKQNLLETTDIYKQYFELNKLLLSEIELKKVESEIDIKIQDSIQKNQRKYYIQEQIKVLNQELGDDVDDDVKPDITKLRKMLDDAALPPVAKEKMEEELDRLRKMHSMSPEYTTSRNYIEVVASIPWNKRTDDNYDINNVKKILDEDHYDLEKPKERILEYIAVLNFAKNLKKQILCFVGPPGVGKTSLAKSIARALGRNFVRFSLGGVRDEAEIRGHRRTYVGAMPGRILQSMKKAGSINPVMLLDEIDKMSTDFRGDPSSALLEVLDPEQNIAFNDHFVDLDYDLSNVMFITTANVKYDIPAPLLDRMEVIELTSYLETDKLNIAKKHIIPKLLNEFGMKNLKISFSDLAIKKIIREYTREAGVRSLEREIGAVLRKVAKEIVSDFGKEHKLDGLSSIVDSQEFKKSFKNKLSITPEKVEIYLKAPIFKDSNDKLKDKVGVVTGLAWTSVGGEILPIEVTLMPAAAEKLTLTGKLGDVMKESAMAALSFVRSNYNKFGVAADFYEKKELHIHVPEGAIPKDGPSAGVTMSIAIISAATGRKVRGDLAMTGEVNLRGEVLAIGGLKEKLLAAKRIGIKKVLIPKDNKRDVEDFKADITEGLEIVPVANVFEAYKHCFVD